jgi:hypothetical protein
MRLSELPYLYKVYYQLNNKKLPSLIGTEQECQEHVKKYICEECQKFLADGYYESASLTRIEMPTVYHTFCGAEWEVEEYNEDISDALQE